MRATAAFLLAIAGTMLAVAIFAYPLYQLAHGLDPDWSFNRIMSRSWQLAMLAAVGVVVWRLRLRGRADWGYGLPRGVFLRQFGLALALGVATMLPMSAVMIGFELRPLRTDVDGARLVHLLLAGLASGLAVALFEETLYRGIMFTAVRRESGLAPATLATATLYAATHFLAKSRIAADEVNWASGFMMLTGTLHWFADPLGMLDAFVSLVLIGVLLALVRHWTGAIAATMGLHMGWVWVLKVTIGVTQPPGDAPGAFLVSRFDGFTGWLIAGWTLVVLVVLVRNRERLCSLRAPGSASH